MIFVPAKYDVRTESWKSCYKETEIHHPFGMFSQTKNLVDKGGCMPNVNYTRSAAQHHCQLTLSQFIHKFPVFKHSESNKPNLKHKGDQQGTS